MNNNVEMFLLKEDIKAHQEVLKNYQFVKSHITRFGITKEGLSIYNEDSNLASELGIELKTSTNTTIVLESISEKIKTIKEKIKEKWNKFKQLFEKKKEDTRTALEKMDDELKEYEKKLKEKNYEFDDSIIVEGITYNDTKKWLDFIVKLEKDLSSESLLKKTKEGFLWIDLSSFKDRLKMMGLTIIEKKTSSGPIEYNFTFKGIELITKEANLKSLGWSSNTIKSILEIFLKGYPIFYLESNAMNLAMKAYGRNMDKIDNNSNEEKEDYLLDCCEDTDSSRGLLEEIVFDLEDMFIEQSKQFMKMLNKIT